MPSTPSVPSPGIPGWFIAIVVIVGVFALGGAIWRFTVLRSGGLNPFVARSQLEARLARSQLLAPPGDASATPPGGGPATPGDAQPARSVEERLAELERLYTSGVITSQELHEARLTILAEK
jgi:hypothetical protein